VPGSDLVPALFDAADPAEPLRVYLLGAAPGVGERAMTQIQRRWPAVIPAGCYSPPLGFEHDERENSEIIARIEAAQPDLLIVGLGAPKQELWVHRHLEILATQVAICAGATIDFLAGERRRAPRWMQRAKLEWLHRLLSEPRRLAWRYLRDAAVFPQLVWQDLARAGQQRRAGSSSCEPTPLRRQ
jgi:N-acetylglucosaminyldiphosphoundecaprenol N-acetyl-beta-D-mannosaminyltransferase